MMRLRRASVIATLSLLAWTATASAECAWVFWQKTTRVAGIELEGASGSRSVLSPRKGSAINGALNSFRKC